MRGLLVLFLTASCTPSLPTCSSTTCAGCCAPSGACIAEPRNAEPTTCGRGGAQCVDCTTQGAQCDSTTFSCTPVVDAGIGAVVADGGASALDACDGCRLASGVCIPAGVRQNNNICGLGGALCSACSGPTPTCRDGACVAPPIRVGDACTEDAACQRTLGSRARCRKTTRAANFEFPGGMCLIEECRSDADCPREASLNNGGTGRSLCIAPQFFMGEETSTCLPTGCTPATGVQGNCRPGYSCVPLRAGVAGCIPMAIVVNGPNDEPPNYDLPNNLHSPCGQDSECRRPTPGAPGVGGLCLTSYGGQCSRRCNSDFDCSNDPEKDVPAYGVCLDDPSGGPGLCFKGCNDPLGGQSNCRPGFVCESSGPLYTTGYCQVRCGTTGTTCGKHSDGGAVECLPTGYCDVEGRRDAGVPSVRDAGVDGGSE